MGQDETGDPGSLPYRGVHTAQAFGDFAAGTVEIQGSMNGSTWVKLTTDGTTDAEFSSAGMVNLHESPRFFRVVSSDHDMAVTVIIGVAER
jgi:hypothetical protein